MSDTNIINEIPDSDTLGGRISRAREAVNVETVELAGNVGVDIATVEAWETDSLEPRPNKLRNLAGILGVSPTWLMEGVGTAPRGELEATEVDMLREQLAEMEAMVAGFTRSIEQMKLSIEAIASARDE